MTKKSILIVDDEVGMREFLELLLIKEGYLVSSAGNGRTALSKLDEESFDLVLCDIRLGDISGIEVLSHAKSLKRPPVVIMISAYSSTEIAIKAMNEGAYDYIPKPYDNKELKDTIKKALKHRTLEREKQNIDKELKSTSFFGGIVGDSPKMIKVYDIIRQAAPSKPIF